MKERERQTERARMKEKEEERKEVTKREERMRKGGEGERNIIVPYLLVVLSRSCSRSSSCRVKIVREKERQQRGGLLSVT